MGADPSQLNAVDPEGDYSGMAGLFSAMAGKEITADMLASGAYLEAVKDISAAMWVDEMRSMGYPNFSASANTKGMLSRISTDWV